MRLLYLLSRVNLGPQSLLDESVVVNVIIPMRPVLGEAAAFTLLLDNAIGDSRAEARLRNED